MKVPSGLAGTSNKVLKEEWLHAELVLLTAGHISILQQQHSPTFQPPEPSGRAMDFFPWPPLFASLCGSTHSGIIATPELAPLSSNQLMLPTPSELLSSSSTWAFLGKDCRLILQPQNHQLSSAHSWLGSSGAGKGNLVGGLRGNK